MQPRSVLFSPSVRRPDFEGENVRRPDTLVAPTDCTKAYACAAAVESCASAGEAVRQLWNLSDALDRKRRRILDANDGLAIEESPVSPFETYFYCGAQGVVATAPNPCHTAKRQKMAPKKKAKIERVQ